MEQSEEHERRYPGAGALPSELPPIAPGRASRTRQRGAPLWVSLLAATGGFLAGAGLLASDVVEFNKHVVEAGEDFPELAPDAVAARAELALSGAREARLTAYQEQGGERRARGSVTLERSPACLARGTRGRVSYVAGPGPEFGAGFGPTLVSGQAGTACDLLERAGKLVTSLRETGRETGPGGEVLIRHEGEVDAARAYVLERADRVALTERRGLVPTSERIDRSSYPAFGALVERARPRVVLVVDTQGRPRRLEIVSTGRARTQREVVEYDLGGGSPRPASTPGPTASSPAANPAASPVSPSASPSASPSS